MSAKATDTHPGGISASLAFKIEKGRLQFSGDLPLRWILWVIIAVATALGYPTVVEAVKILLRIR